MNTQTATITTILTLLLCTQVITQDFSLGYDYLNSGDYSKAEIFFTKAINDFPNNKTAQICYGRAVGLNGNPSKAKNTFNTLVNQYPNDKESQLNLAESFLWNKEPIESIKLYEELNIKYPKDELIIRSLANAYALNLDYVNAFDFATEALQTNTNNRTSQEAFKTIGLAYAHTLKSEKNYLQSLDILNQLEIIFPSNKDIIISKAFNFLADKKYSSAETEFNKLGSLDLDKIGSILGLASISLQKGKFNQSLNYLKNSLLAIDNLTQQQKIEKWDLLFGNYLSINPKKAKEVLTYLNEHLSPSQLAEKQIYVHLELEDFKGIQALLEKITNKTVKQNIKLRHALESNEFKRFDTILSNIDYQISNSYTENLIRSIKSQQRKQLSSRYEIAKDNGNNLSNELNIFYQSAKAQTWSPFARVQSRWLENTRQNQGLSNHSILTIGTNISIGHRGLLNIGLGIESIRSVESSNSILPRYDISYRLQFNKRHFTKLIVFKKQLNYNQNLLSQNINKYNFGVEHHIVSRSGLGSYSQVNSILLSDKNLGLDIFNSLYYNLKNNPIIQTGLNTTFLSFQELKPEYFSPQSLISVSPFFKLSNEYRQHVKIKYSILGSMGQQIDFNISSNQFIYSIQIKTGYHLSEKLYSEIFYTYANNSSAINNGFSSYFTGLNLNYSL